MLDSESDRRVGWQEPGRLMLTAPLYLMDGLGKMKLPAALVQSKLVLDKFGLPRLELSPLGSTGFRCRFPSTNPYA